MTLQPAGRARRAGTGRRTAVLTPLGRLEVILADAGIAQDRFALATAAAIAELRAAEGVAIDDPETQLSEPERRDLVMAGLDLSPRRARDPVLLAAFAARYAALLADSEDVGQVAERLGVTRARVRQRALEHSLLAIREGDEWRFPVAQFDESTSTARPSSTAPIRGLPAVSMALPLDLHPVEAWRFLNEPNADLELGDRDVSPLDWLRSGGSPDPVVAIAREL
ncbi:MAG TPA: helix-turn-helix domain-containing protein [Candidatus Limnocylindrales bacterium]|nr:helix-turn-helix domain-containing protein [Candidatus Limnocylindrales bacterium]